MSAAIRLPSICLTCTGWFSRYVSNDADAWSAVIAVSPSPPCATVIGPLHQINDPNFLVEWATASS
eukprot:13433037-Ditylum_brightwellii.AAC.1